MALDTNLATNIIYRGDCYNVLKRNFPSGNDKHGVDLIYVDPPFSFDPKYAKLWYDKESLEMFEEIRKGDVKHYISWMSKRLEQFHRVLKDTGSFYLHCDWKFGHHLKVALDDIFGRNNFQNEIIWWYGGGGASKRRFARKHDTIFFYTKGKTYTFNIDEVREPYKWTNGQKRADGTERNYEKGKIPDDVWQMHGLMPWSKERKNIGYPTQKPEVLLERIINASSNEGDIILDPMCGCGTTLVVAHKLKRKWIGIDISSQACEVMKKRMSNLGVDVEVKGLPLTLDDLKKLKPFEFQDYICDMTNSRKMQYVSDKGIDGLYREEFPVQIKQQERVGRNVVDNFETALRRKGRPRGYIIGFSFTKGAYEEAARAKSDGLDIMLVELPELVRYDYDLESLTKEA